MTIILAPETEAKLLETAQREGTEVNALANQLLAEVLEHKARDFAQNVAAIQEGLDAVRQGRERPFEQFLSEHQALNPAR